MDDLFLVNLQVSLNDLVYEVAGLGLGEFLRDFLVEVTRAQLCDDVCVVFSCVYLVEFQYMGHVLNLLEDLNLGLK